MKSKGEPNRTKKSVGTTMWLKEKETSDKAPIHCGMVTSAALIFFVVSLGRVRGCRIFFEKGCWARRRSQVEPKSPFRKCESLLRGEFLGCEHKL